MKDFFERLPLTLASQQRSFRVRLSCIHVSPTDISPWGRNELRDKRTPKDL